MALAGVKARVATLLDRPAIDALVSAPCLNCGTPLAGPFCSSCGQRAAPASPTLRELAGDAFIEFSGWDGKLAETLRALLWHPGRLTREFIAGRRVRYLSPVRLYLTMSLVYFVVAAAAPELGPTMAIVSAPGISVGLGNPNAGPGRVAPVAGDTRQGTPSKAERDSALSDIAHAPKIIRPVLRRAVEDPAGFKSSLFRNMPRALFTLLPVFAGIVALFYRKRNFPEHLYFALHLHAFVFLALMASILAKFTNNVKVATSVKLAVCAWIVVYTLVALRRVYGGSIVRTLAKGAGIGALYLVAGGLALSVLAYFTAVYS